jgi:hypothetical protein
MAAAQLLISGLATALKGLDGRALDASSAQHEAALQAALRAAAAPPPPLPASASSSAAATSASALRAHPALAIGPLVDAVLDDVLTRVIRTPAHQPGALAAANLLRAAVAAADAPRAAARHAAWASASADALRRAVAAVGLGQEQQKAGKKQDEGEEEEEEQPQQQASGAPPSSSADAAAAAAAAVTAAALARACTALFRRLAPLVDLQGVRRELSGAAGRMVVPLVRLVAAPARLRQQRALAAGAAAGATTTATTAATAAAEARCDLDALEALESILRCVPGAVKQHVPAVEAAAAGAMVGAAAAAAAAAETTAPPAQLLGRAAAVLAALPAAAQDPAPAWASACARAIVTCHDLCSALLGPLERGGGGGGGAGGGRPSSSSSKPGSWGPRSDGLPYGLALWPWQQQQQQQQQAPPSPVVNSAAAAKAAALLLAAAIDTAERLLSSPFAAPLAAPVPAAEVVRLSRRLLRADPASAMGGATSGSAGAARVALLLQPQLHTSAWRLLSALLACSSAAPCTLIPLQGAMVRLVREEALRPLRVGGASALAAAGPILRRAGYAASVSALRSGGMVAAKALAPDVMGAVLVELYGAATTTSGGGPGSYAAAAAAAAAASAAAASSGGGKRRKGGGGGGSVGLDVAAAAAGQMGLAASGASSASAAALAAAAAAAAGSGGSGGAPIIGSADDDDDLSAQAQALRLLAALVECGGTALPAELRAHADAVAAHVAAAAAAAAERLRSLDTGAAASSTGRAAALGALGDAAAAALLASVLSPCPLGHRPPFFPAALRLLGGEAPWRPPAASSGVRLEALLRPRAVAYVAGGGGGAGPSAVGAQRAPRLWLAVDGGAAAALATADVAAAAQAALEAAGRGAAALEAVGKQRPSKAGGSGGAAAFKRAREEEEEVVEEEEEEEMEEEEDEGAGADEEEARRRQPAAAAPARAPPPPARRQKQEPALSSDSEGSLPEIDSGSE